MYVCILKFQQFKLKVWRRLRIPFRFFVVAQITKINF